VQLAWATSAATAALAAGVALALLRSRLPAWALVARYAVGGTFVALH